METPTMTSVKLLAVCLTAFLVSAPALTAQSLQEEVILDLRGVQSKVVGLAEAVPVDQYDWRPGEGVRSVGEVFMHIASANFRFPGMLGIDPPDVPETWVKGDATGLDRQTAVAAVNASFEYLYSVIQGVDDLTAPINVFGRDTNGNGFLTITATHLHEHLGQSIAYARTLGVVPPWSG
jgi:uncharacterized damage-inducible protein DinB